MEDKDNIILNLNFFGSFQIRYEGEILTENNWKSKKALNILKFIASRENKKVKKDILLDKFWSKNDKNIKKLHSTIYYLRNTIKNFINNNQICILNYNNGIYSLNSNIFDIDYENLISTYKNARKLEKNNKSHTALQKYKYAMARYNGDFLKDDLYKDWTREFRQYYREIYIDIILRTSSLIVDLKKDYNRAVELCQKGLDIDSYREELYHSLLSYLIKAGYYGKAAQKYREYSKMLSEEFSIYPGPRTQELFKKINIENNRRLKGNDSYVFQCDKKTFDLIFNLNKICQAS